MPCFFHFPVSCVLHEKFCDFYWPQLPITCNCQDGFHKQKKDTVSAREGKVSLLHRGGQSQGCALTYGARSPQATKTWPRVTENIVQVTQPGDMLVLVS